jgi:hypothetical protein
MEGHHVCLFRGELVSDQPTADSHFFVAHEALCDLGLQRGDLRPCAHKGVSY